MIGWPGLRPAMTKLNQTTSLALSPASRQEAVMIRKLASGEYRLYSLKKNPRTGKRRNLGTFKSRAAAEKHEREVQYFKRH
jgi:hypothetical protein